MDDAEKSKNPTGSDGLGEGSALYRDLDQREEAKPDEYVPKWRDQLPEGATSEDAFKQCVLWDGGADEVQTLNWLDWSAATPENVPNRGDIRLQTTYTFDGPVSFPGGNRQFKRESEIVMRDGENVRQYKYSLKPDKSTAFVEIVDGEESPPLPSSELDKFIDIINNDCINTSGLPVYRPS